MDSEVHEQAAEVAEMLPKLVRRFFAIDTEGPTVDLPVAQLRVCGILRGGPRTMSSLGSELGISLSAVTQTADRLERSGLVERVVEAGDHRLRHLQLTQRGMEAVEARISKRVEKVLDALSKLPPEERGIAVHGLQVLLGAAADAGQTESEHAADMQAAVR